MVGNRDIIRSTLLFFLLHIGGVKTQSAVTYLDRKDWGGRLGDMLIMYTKAKWIAFHYKLPFWYKPFVYSDQLELHFKERHFDQNIAKKYRKKMNCRDAPESLDKYIRPQDDILYTIHYYFALAHWSGYQKKYDAQEIMMWPEIYNDQDFIQELKKNIIPHVPILLDTVPHAHTTVAVHIRMGGGFDLPLLSRQLYTLDELDSSEIAPPGKYADKYWPTKFLPLQYYVDQIKRLSEMQHDENMYVHIYTDDKDPVALKETIRRTVNKDNILFDCRIMNNHHGENVLKDMFAMAQYDCLIRSASNYPQISQLVGNHGIVIYPKSCKWIGNTLIVDEVGTFIRACSN